MAKYPWDKCIREQKKRYGSEEKARKVCGSIYWKYGPGSKKDAMLVESEGYPEPSTILEVFTIPDGIAFEDIVCEIERELGISPVLGQPKLFELYRRVDETGVSGVGVVAHGVQFVDGLVVLRWLGDLVSTSIYKDIDTTMAIHGHDGKTEIVWREEVQHSSREGR